MYHINNTEAQVRNITHYILSATIIQGLMLLIPLYAASSDLTSPPTPFSFPQSTDGGGFGKVRRVLKLFPIIP